ncbi:LysR family transcriptional regulator [Gilvimarinus sp. SDUM040013]|uniref:LysR family transcriptional regulator n=1 Tax=Gilvimarinus gilvus TaxID=3058038 RepID=A0ABU4RYQ2_9GAMM|nr:LysR family transcriptional regulator [Gilvimarinus sp. SDUM040013]MDO3386339.1 LysR family transcriptional regulator [Gilvimarinus sp. SDUM040013]MDX6850003.1 LysR family transcriptional regulator [Gilvimarinus sp. SDUM040013]
MDTEHLKLFHRVAMRKGFAAVAREDGIDPSLVSRQIATLEQQLGFKLFHRSTRKVSLTSAGAVYLQQTTPLIEELEQARECALKQHSEPEGKLVITASTAFGQRCLLPLVPEFCQRYPKLILDLRFTDAVVDILSEQVDLACRFASSPDPNLVAQKLFDTEFWACASPGYLQQKGTPESPRQLRELELLAINLPGYREAWMFQGEYGEEHRVAFSPRMLVSNAMALRELTLRGLGCSLLASWMVREDVRAGRLIRLCPQYRVSATDFQSAAWLLYPSRRYQPAKTQVMVSYLKEMLVEPV